MDWTNKKVLVTGGAGFLGSFLVEQLKERGCHQLVLPRSKDTDLTDRRQIQNLFKKHQPEVVFHLAARVGGIGANLKNPGKFFYENAIMGIELMEQARLAGVEKFVALGTICAYPKFAPIPFKEEDIWTGYPEETNAPYGLAKKMMLVQSQAYREQYGFNSLYLLPVNLYGPRDNFDLESSHVISALIRKAVTARETGRKEIVLWGDGSPTREFLFVEDAAEAIILAAEKLNESTPVNLGSGQEISIGDLAHLIVQAVGYEGEITWDKSRPNGQPRRKLDVSRAKNLLGFEAKTDLKTGIQKTLAWYLLNRPDSKDLPSIETKIEK